MYLTDSLEAFLKDILLSSAEYSRKSDSDDSEKVLTLPPKVRHKLNVPLAS